MKINIATLAAAAGIALAAGLSAVPAQAALIGTFDGNDCAGEFGGNFNSCSYNGSAVIAKFDANGSVQINTSLFPTVTGNEFSFVNMAAGSWTYTPGAGDPVITYYVAKGGPSFNLFSNDGAPNSGDFVTPTNPNNGRPYGLSHLTFYGTPGTTTVPEPASLALFGMGLAGLGLATRRKRDA